MRPFLVGAATGSVIGATLVGVFLVLFDAQAEAWERRRIDKYHVRFPTVTIPAPVYTSSLPQRTFGGVTRHVVVDWSDAPAT